MTFIDFFAGIGGFRKGLEDAGHKCIGFCENDKFAAASYVSMHLITDLQREQLEKLTLRERQKEILKDEYRNGEWYSSDIRTVTASDVPRADCWCFGAPCQDFSIAGKRAGLAGRRSSLVQEIFRLLEEQKEQDRPEWLIYENVKGMFSANKGLDYLSIVSEMDRLGYDIEWQNIHTEWYLPQHRERIYTVGHLRKHGRAKVLPIKGTDGKHKIQVIGTTQPNRHSSGDIYDVNGIAPTILRRDANDMKQIAIPIKEVKEQLHYVWCENNHKNITVRKLTPKECFRLQGWTDSYFEKAKFVNSDNQLYKQAGNGVTVNIIKEIGKRLNQNMK